MRFDRSDFTSGLVYFMADILVGSAVGGVIGMGMGWIGGRIWETVHRARRTDDAADSTPAPARATAPAAVDPAPAAARAQAPAAIRFDTTGVTAESFLALAQRVWPRSYDSVAIAGALENTINIGAWDGPELVGSVRVLTDGYLFSTVPEILVDPAYQRRGIGAELMKRALAAAPGNTLFLGAQPESRLFFEKIGCVRGPTGYVMRRN